MKKINGANHQEKDLSIKTVAVEIKVMTVDGKRMTKAVFDQIPESDPFDENLALKRGVQAMGYVNTKDSREVLVFSENGQLRRCDIHLLFLAVLKFKARDNRESVRVVGDYIKKDNPIRFYFRCDKPLFYPNNDFDKEERRRWKSNPRIYPHYQERVNRVLRELLDFRKKVNAARDARHNAAYFYNSRMPNVLEFIESIKDEQIYISI